MTFEGQLGMCIGLMIGNFLGGWAINKSWMAGLFQAIVVLPIYAIVATIAYKVFGAELL